MLGSSLKLTKHIFGNKSIPKVKIAELRLYLPGVGTLVVGEGEWGWGDRADDCKPTQSGIPPQQSTQMQKILILAATPQGLRVDQEIRDIEEAIKRAVKRDLFEIKVRTAIRPQDIRRGIAEERPQIVHFCGHGMENGSLVLEDDGGNHKPILPIGLAALFKLHTDYVKCVLLNACYSDLAAEAISKHINYVIGMNHLVKGRAAIVFAQGFYDGLGYDNINNLDIIQRAFDEGIVAIQLENLLQGAIPSIWKLGITQSEIVYRNEVPIDTFNLTQAVQQRNEISSSTEIISFPTQTSQPTSPELRKGTFSGYTKYDSEIVTEIGNFSRYQVKVTVHENYTLGLDNYIASEFAKHNQRRQNKNLREHFESTLYRLICLPKVDGNRLKLDVAPINFAYLALLIDPDIPESENPKAYINNKISNIASHISKELKSNHPYINEWNHIPLGIEFVLITNDGKTLLRRRGQSVATSRGEWDVSFSGYCAYDDRETGNLEIWKTVNQELGDEIGHEIPKDPSKMCFMALHRNQRTGATDLLGYWKVEISSEQLAELLTDEYPQRKTTVFKTTKEAQEVFVWDTDNIIVDFDGNSISTALKEVNSEIDTLMPEARVALDLALKTLGKPQINW